ncbi:MAG: protein-L-isoaspartate O-methyltransferase, partial [Candidatus Aenigmatarchaeota archaeon]
MRDNEDLIDVMKKKGNLTSERVESSLLKVPRERFVPDKYRKRAYVDAPLSIGEGQTISQPSVVAKMTQWLEPEEGDKILEIGAGSGWQAALLGNLVGNSGKVYTVERKEKLADRAEKNIRKVGLNNVEVVVGDGSTGLEEHEPYDGIICTAACPEIPE